MKDGESKSSGLVWLILFLLLMIVAGWVGPQLHTHEHGHEVESYDHRHD